MLLLEIHGFFVSKLFFSKHVYLCVLCKPSPPTNTHRDRHTHTDIHTHTHTHQQHPPQPQQSATDQTPVALLMDYLWLSLSLHVVCNYRHTLTPPHPEGKTITLPITFTTCRPRTDHLFFFYLYLTWQVRRLRTNSYFQLWPVG